MVSTKAVTDAYADTLARLADHTERLVLVQFDSLEDYSDGDEFRSTTRPLVEAAAQASIDTTGAYLETIGLTPGDPSDLIVADAAARCYDPFDRLAANLGKGMDWTDALVGARSQARRLGDDSVHRTARDAMAQMAPQGKWQRRLSSSCCQWCMKLSGVIFDFASQATFGHAHCRCIAVPVGAVASHNEAIRGGEGFDAQAEDLWDQRQARKSLRDQADNAARRSSEAATEALIEADPVRRDRLETRAQEWETRAEAASERLRILETGSHRLAA